MKIDFLRARRKREQDEGIPWFAWPLMPVLIPAFLVAEAFGLVRDHLFVKNYCLFINCTEEQRTAVQFTLKSVLGLPYVEFQRIERRVPGPVFRGSREALEWLAEGLRKERIPCRVRRVFPKTVEKLDIFLYPLAQNMSIDDAFRDCYVTYEVRQAWLEHMKRNSPSC